MPAAKTVRLVVDGPAIERCRHLDRMLISHMEIGDRGRHSDTRFFWFALSRFDVFEVDGISHGSLPPPVGLIGTVRNSKDEHSPAT